jgi:hypothetical protein
MHIDIQILFALFSLNVFKYSMDLDLFIIFFCLTIETHNALQFYIFICWKTWRCCCALCMSLASTSCACSLLGIVHMFIAFFECKVHT